MGVFQKSAFLTEAFLIKITSHPGKPMTKNQKYFYESDEDFMAALRKDYKKIDIQRELQVVDLTNGGKIQPYVKGLQIENELNKVL